MVSSNLEYKLGMGVVACEQSIGVKEALSLLLLVPGRQQIVLWLVPPPPPPCHLPHTILLQVRPSHCHPQGWQVWQDQEIWLALGALENFWLPSFKG